jgi:uncharacterized protein (TIGR00730 family)
MVLSEAEKFGFELARAGFTVLYGGATSGSMGALAEGVVIGGGNLIGVVPTMDFMTGLIHHQLTETVTVSTMAERKTQMILRSDGFMAMPGGIGTLDEVTEVLALNGVGALNKPLVFYNFLGLWTPILESLDLLHQSGFISAPPTDLFQVFERSESVIEYLKHAL